MNLYKNSRRLWWDRICKIMCIYSNNKCMCVFLISPVPIAEPLTSEFIDTPVFHNLAPRPIKYRVSGPIPSGGSWCLDPSLSPFLVKFTQILESIFLDNPHKAAVLSVGCASFSSTLFPSTQLSVNMLGYSTLWTASFFGNECLWLTLLVKGVNDCLLDNCQISSLPHDCVA